MRKETSIFDMIQELAAIQEDMLHMTHKLQTYDIYDFNQTWASTALGFGGVGGSAMTTARTYVLVDDDKAYVFFGGRFAYTCGTNEEFHKDLANHNMASVVGSTKYGKVKRDE